MSDRRKSRISLPQCPRLHEVTKRRRRYS